MTDPSEIRAWLRLIETPQVGRESARRLLAAFGSAQSALAASIDARREVVGPAQADALAASSAGLDALVDATIAWLQADSVERRSIVVIGDEFYPPALLNSADPPLLLYVQGRPQLLARLSVAVVGSRNPTRQGVDNAQAFAQHLGRAGLVVVSGMALGIDTAAHEGALEGSPEGLAGTIAVVGTGLNRVYPKRNLALARRIAEHGAIVSEFAIGTPPLPHHFPMRNRIIAGLAQGTLVVEAALKSGSLSTARLTLDANREVFAIPGSIHSPQSRGCHWLIKQGAKLVESAEDILEELRPAGSVGRPRQASLDDALSDGDTKTADSEDRDTETADDPLLAALGFDPANLDVLVARTGWSAAALSVRLLELELDGLVARLPGQLFQRTGASRSPT